MSEMKLIMENWRHFSEVSSQVLNEQSVRNCRATFANAGQFRSAYEAASAVARKDKNAKELLDKLQTGADWALAVGGLLAATGLLTGGAGTVLGGAVAGFAGMGNMILGMIRSGRNKKFDKRTLDTIFKAMCIDPAILDVTDDELEEKIMQTEAPFNDMETYLNGLQPNDPVPDLNGLFVAAINKHLKITDQSELQDKS
tara:strand:- start:9 stop:605 length:597 start_codon:yes stop_codon:yes gene_type:complete